MRKGSGVSDRIATGRPSIVTRRGDTGKTDLLFGGRVPKCHPQVDCCGTIDEFSAALGVARAACPQYAKDLIAIQKVLVAIMGEIACAADRMNRYYGSEFPQIGAADVEFLDRCVAEIEEVLPPFQDWVLPGTGPESAALEMARAVARRAERRLVALRDENAFPLRSVIIEYFNRVSDYLWLLARQTERAGES